jgi:dihydrofolate reductase
MVVSLIVAVSENKVIGKDNDLAWHLPDDMSFFKNSTKGHHIIMGRKNYDSIPLKYRPLPNRTNIIVTRQEGYTAEGCIVVHSIEEGIELARKAGDQEPFVIGGGQIYSYSLEKNLIDRVYLTRVHTDIEGDTFFDNLEEDWKEVYSEKHPKDERHPYAFTFLTYEKK